MTMRGQSAIEFITTYGLVFFIIAVALSVLLIFTFVPKSASAPNCNMYGVLRCVALSYTNNSNNNGVTVEMEVSDAEPGVLNISSFNTSFGTSGANSINGFCTPTRLTQGESSMCVANITSTSAKALLGSSIAGTVKIATAYCAPGPSTFSTSYCQSSGSVVGGASYTFLGSFTAPAEPPAYALTESSPLWSDEGNYGSWTGVASSSVNSVVAVQYGSGIWNSSNLGITWAKTTAPTQNWTAVALSSDGTHIAATAAYNAVWTSPTSGLTWIQTPTIAGWDVPTGYLDGVSLSSSDDGSSIAAATANGDIYLSGSGAGPTFGSAYVQQISSSADWQGIAEIPNGQLIIAVEQDQILSYSSFSDVWYTSSSLSSNFSAVAACGYANAFAVENGGGILVSNSIRLPYTSQTWYVTSAPTGDWKAVACSSDGSHIAAVQYNGGIWVSTDSGSTWNPTTAPNADWTGIASSYDGNTLVAVQQNGDIFVGKYVA